MGRCIATETVIREDVIAIPRSICQQRAAGHAGPRGFPDGEAVRNGAALTGDVAAGAIPTPEYAFVTRFLMPPGRSTGRARQPLAPAVAKARERCPACTYG